MEIRIFFGKNKAWDVPPVLFAANKEARNTVNEKVGCKGHNLIVKT